MKRSVRTVSIFLAVITIMSMFASVSAMAADAIDVSSANEGSFSVYYTSSAKLKVGVTFGGQTTFYNYTSGQKTSFAFEKGNGDYTVKVYENISGTSYRTAASKSVSVKLSSEYAQYLVSTDEITFSDDDAVSKKAAELCSGLTTNSAKVVAIYNYIVENYSYDKTFASKVNSGEISVYTPDTEALISSDKGVCYDFAALFAAMCRSQDIPCVMTKGYLSTKYHAWNKVNVDGSWYQIDMTYSVNKKDTADVLSNCLTPLTSYSQASDTIVTNAIAA